MESPFPGMDPYLEAPSRWESVHTQLICLLPQAIGPQLPDRYSLSVEERIYMTVMEDDALRLRQPDLTVVDLDPTAAEGGVAVLAPPRSTLVRVSQEEHARERFLVVRDGIANEDIVTVLELLSPTNKLVRAGRDEYLLKRGAVMASRVNLVEIDLLRSGDRMPMEPPPSRSDYGFLVSRGVERPWAHWIGFDLSDAIPAFPLPLRPGDPEPTIELRPLLDQICRSTRLLRRVDYTQPPTPSLRAEDSVWADHLLHEKGLR